MIFGKFRLFSLICIDSVLIFYWFQWFSLIFHRFSTKKTNFNLLNDLTFCIIKLLDQTFFKSALDFHSRHDGTGFRSIGATGRGQSSFPSGVPFFLQDPVFLPGYTVWDLRIFSQHDVISLEHFCCGNPLQFCVVFVAPITGIRMKPSSLWKNRQNYYWQPDN